MIHSPIDVTSSGHSGSFKISWNAPFRSFHVLSVEAALSKKARPAAYLATLARQTGVVDFSLRVAAERTVHEAYLVPRRPAPACHPCADPYTGNRRHRDSTSPRTRSTVASSPRWSSTSAIQ